MPGANTAPEVDENESINPIIVADDNVAVIVIGPATV